MSSWLFHGMLGSLGLALGAACAGALLLVWRRQPLASYRLVVLVLIGALVLPVCQVLAERWELPRGLPFAEDLATLRASWSERTATAPVEDEAPPVVALEPAEAQLLLVGTLLSSRELLESVPEDGALTGAAAPAPAAALTP